MTALDEQYDRLRAAELKIEVIHLEMGELLKVIGPWSIDDASFRLTEEPATELARYTALQTELRKAGKAMEEARHAISDTEVEARRALVELQQQEAAIAMLEAKTPANERHAARIAEDLRHARGYRDAAQRKLAHIGPPRTKVAA